MKKLLTTLAAMNVVLLGVAGCADTTAPAASMAAPSTMSMNYSSQSLGGTGVLSNVNAPGVTGQAIVRGDDSTIAGDANATSLQRTGALGGE